MCPFSFYGRRLETVALTASLRFVPISFQFPLKCTDCFDTYIIDWHATFHHICKFKAGGDVPVFNFLS